MMNETLVNTTATAVEVIKPVGIEFGGFKLMHVRKCDNNIVLGFSRQLDKEIFTKFKLTLPLTSAEQLAELGTAYHINMQPMEITCTGKIVMTERIIVPYDGVRKFSCEYDNVKVSVFFPSNFSATAMINIVFGGDDNNTRTVVFPMDNKRSAKKFSELIDAIK